MIPTNHQLLGAERDNLRRAVDAEEAALRSEYSAACPHFSQQDLWSMKRQLIRFEVMLVKEK
jgi:hypothetical protein